MFPPTHRFRPSLTLALGLCCALFLPTALLADPDVPPPAPAATEDTATTEDTEKEDEDQPKELDAADYPVRSSIKTRVFANSDGIRRCYQKGLKKNPELAGVLVVKFAITPEGKVDAPSLWTSSLNAPKTETCIVRAFKKLEFDESDEGFTEVLFPLNLAPN